MLGILVHGDNHFIVDGPEPDDGIARELVRHWSIIEIGATMPPALAPWRILTKAFREDLEWAVLVPGGSETSTAVAQLLDELNQRGVIMRRAT
jgi:hypothetical protein